MFQTETCNFRCTLRVLLICTGSFFFLSLINVIALAGFFQFKYNTTYECIYQNVTHCFNDPDNRMIAEWATGLAFVIVLTGLMLFIIYLGVLVIKRRRATTYEIVTNINSSREELVYEVNPSNEIVIDSDPDSLSSSGERAKKED